jgi:hypothetical protein
MCELYNDLFGRNPDPAGAEYWVSVIEDRGLDMNNPADKQELTDWMKDSAQGADCAAIGGTFNPVTKVCHWR